MIITINDDFDPEKIIKSGQCFRALKKNQNTFRFVTGNSIIYLQKIDEKLYCASCNEKEWNAIWSSYFDLNRNYKGIRAESYGKNKMIDKALDEGKGIRILHQEPWEVLLTFIISQRKSIPAIARSVEAIAAKYGKSVDTGCEILHLFPTPNEMKYATEQELRNCGVGYRAPYIADAVHNVLNSCIDLKKISTYSTPVLLQELQKINGVGIKVANCVALFAYGRMDCVPIDVWISRAIKDECNDNNPFPLFGENAGIIQQYVFYYQKSRQ